MGKIKKDYNVKLTSLILVATLFMPNTAYSINISYKKANLRIPLIATKYTNIKVAFIPIEHAPEFVAWIQKSMLDHHIGMFNPTTVPNRYVYRDGIESSPDALDIYFNELLKTSPSPSHIVVSVGESKGTALTNLARKMNKNHRENNVSFWGMDLYMNIVIIEDNVLGIAAFWQHNGNIIGVWNKQTKRLEYGITQETKNRFEAIFKYYSSSMVIAKYHRVEQLVSTDVMELVDRQQPQTKFYVVKRLDEEVMKQTKGSQGSLFFMQGDMFKENVLDDLELTAGRKPTIIFFANLLGVMSKIDQEELKQQYDQGELPEEFLQEPHSVSYFGNEDTLRAIQNMGQQIEDSGFIVLVMSSKGRNEILTYQRRGNTLFYYNHIGEPTVPVLEEYRTETEEVWVDYGDLAGEFKKMQIRVFAGYTQKIFLPMPTKYHSLIDVSTSI